MQNREKQRKPKEVRIEKNEADMTMKCNAWFSELDFEPERKGGKGNNFVTPIPYYYCYYYYYYFWPHHMAHVILVPHPGIEPVPPTLESQSLNHWTAREVLYAFLY